MEWITPHQDKLRKTPNWQFNAPNAINGVIHAKNLLKPADHTVIEKELELIWCCCGSVFCDIESTEENVLKNDTIHRNLNCLCLMEIPYYIAGHRSHLLSL